MRGTINVGFRFTMKWYFLFYQCVFILRRVKNTLISIMADPSRKLNIVHLFFMRLEVNIPCDFLNNWKH